MKHLFTLLLAIFLVSSVTLYAQTTGKISGKVTMVDGSPLTSASVSIVGSAHATLTDDRGNYSFNGLAPGTYTVKIQVLGSPQKTLQADVVADQTTNVNYQLPTENIQALQEVTVSGNTNKFAKKESYYIARLPLKNIENPQVYNSVPKELFEEQVAVSLGDVAKEIPGAGIPTIANQGRVTFLSRGFETEPNARNGVAGQAFSSIDNANLERLEAIKGPSATLFGTSISSSYGGLFNRVTKKPYNGFGGEVSYTGGSWNMNRVAVDLNTPINADKTALFRINAATTFQKSFQDLGFTNNISVAPSFSYQINDRLSILLDVEFGQEKGTSVVRFNPYTGGTKVRTLNIETMGFPYKKTFTSNDMPYQTQMLNIFGQLNYKISSEWTSQTVISRARSTINGYITALTGRSDTSLRAQVITGNTSFIATDLQQNFIGDFKIAGHRNRMVAGLDYYNNSNSFDRVTVNYNTISFIHPPASYRISKFKIDSLSSSGTLRKENNGDNTYATYVSDVFNVTDKLSVMASLRLDRYQYGGVYNITTGVTAGGLGANGVQIGPYGQTALSQKMGLVYEVVKDQLSLFGNYMNGFFNESGVFSDGSRFKPEHANQLEMGVKGDLFNHRLVGTVSYYDIRVADIIRPDPANPTQYSIQDGTQLSKGVEVDLTANPFQGFNIIAGYAYNDSKLTKSDPTTNGLRPANSGPARMLNYWMSYRMPEGDLRGMGVGFGGNSGSSSYNVNTTTLKVIVPAYTILDATVFYDQPKFRIGLKVNNITNEKSWSLRLTPQDPTQFLGTLALKF